MNIATRFYSEKVHTITAAGSTGAQTAFTLPRLYDYNFYQNIVTMTGANQTFDTSLQITPDDGTTWLTFARFTQVVVATKISYRMSFRGSIGPADVMNASAVVFNDTAEATASALSAAGPLSTKVRFFMTQGGTVTTLTGQIWLVGNVVEGGLI